MFHSVLDAKKCLAEILRISKPGAYIIIIDLFRTAKRFSIISRIKDNIHSIRYEYGVVSNYHRPQEFEKMLLYPIVAQEDVIKEGLVFCLRCGTAYPIINELPCFLLEEIRDEEIKLKEKSYLEIYASSKNKIDTPKDIEF